MATALDKVLSRGGAAKPVAGTVHWLNECIERGKREVFSETVTITPGLANVLLGKNDGNRNIRSVKLGQFASDMRAGRWAFNGEPIIVAKTGELNDGQHRLSAVIEANMPVRFLIVFGIERPTRLTVDQGAARNAGDFLGMEGVPNHTSLAAITRLVIAYERGGGSCIYRTHDITNAEIRLRAERDPRLHASATFAIHYFKSTKAFAAPAIIGFCHYVLSGEHEADAQTYMTQIATGEGLRKTDPAYVVRDRLLTLGKGREPKAEIILRGWNAYRANRPLKLVKVLGNLPALV